MIKFHIINNTIMVTHDVVILTSSFEIGKFQKGMGYRYWELAQALADKGISVALVCPNLSEFSYPNITLLLKESYTNEDLSKLSNTFMFCLLEDPELIKYLKDLKKNLIYDSVLTPIEGLTFQAVLNSSDDLKRNEHFLNSVKNHKYLNSVSDYYLLGTPEEKLLKIGELLGSEILSEKDNKELPHRMVVLPVCGYNKKSLVELKTDKESIEQTIIWNGGIWNHYDYTVLLESFKDLSKLENNIKLKFLYRNNTNSYKTIVNFIKDNGLDKTISIPTLDDVMPGVIEKQEILKDAKALILLNENTILSELVLPMRLREALIFSKPIIVSKYGVLGKFVLENEVGIAVDNTIDEIKKAILDMCTKEEEYQKYKSNIKKLRNKYLYENYIDSIISFISKDK